MPQNFIVVTARFDPADEDERGFVVFCPELGISSQGDTIEEASQAIREAAQEFLESLAGSGDLSRFLSVNKISTYHDRPEDPVATMVTPDIGELVSAFVATIGEVEPSRI